MKVKVFKRAHITATTTGNKKKKIKKNQKGTQCKVLSLPVPQPPSPPPPEAATATNFFWSLPEIIDPYIIKPIYVHILFLCSVEVGAIYTDHAHLALFANSIPWDCSLFMHFELPLLFLQLRSIPLYGWPRANSTFPLSMDTEIVSKLFD